MLLEIQSPDAADLERRTKRQLSIAEATEVTSQAMYDEAAEQCSSIKAKIKELNERRVAITKPLDEAKAQVMNLFREPLNLLASAEQLLKGRMLAWSNEQERIRREEQRKAEAAAQAERDRLEQEARQREAEAAAAAQAAAKAAEQPADAEAASKAQEAMQAAAESQQAAASLRMQAATTIAPVVAMPVKTAGVATRGIWTATVTDKMALVRFVAAHPEYLAVLDVNDTALRALARAQQQSLALDGVSVSLQQSIAVKARR